jgi:seryl-tRNA synthetase
MVGNALSLPYIENETVRSVTPVSVENEAEELGEISDSEGDDGSIKSNVTEVSKQGTNKKRKLAVANVPRLIDNKRKSLDKRLSAAQKDQKLVEAAKEDTAMRKDMLECFRDSSRSTAQAMENISTTLREMSQGMTQAMMSLANAFNVDVS